MSGARTRPRAGGDRVTLGDWLRRRRRILTLTGGAAIWAALAAILWRGVLAEPAAVEWGRRSLRVMEVLDGRTLRVTPADAKVGAGEGETTLVRLLGVAATEAGKSGRARRELARLRGQEVVLSFDPRRWRDEAGRLVGYVYTRSGRMINEQLVRDGIARRSNEPHELRGWFGRLQKQAQIRNRGIWADEKGSR